MSNEENKNNKFYKDLSSKLGIDHDLVETKSENNLPKKIDQSSQSLAKLASEEEMRLFESDFHAARQTIQELSLKYQQIIDNYANLVEASESARHYEVLIKMMDSAGKMANDLVDLHHKKENYRGSKKSDKDKPDASMNIHSANIIVGTTADIMKKIDDENNGND